MEREALKRALETLKEISRHATTPYEDAWCGELAEEAITAINALAQPEQEPWRESASDYERGFIDGRQKQAQSSVDKAVNRMAQRPWVEPTGNEWFEWWRVSAIADETQAEIDFADFLIIAQAVMTKLKKDNK